VRQIAACEGDNWSQNSFNFYETEGLLWCKLFVINPFVPELNVLGALKEMRV
jgi:hypothetical protein